MRIEGQIWIGNQINFISEKMVWWVVKITRDVEHFGATLPKHKSLKLRDHKKKYSHITVWITLVIWLVWLHAKISPSLHRSAARKEEILWKAHGLRKLQGKCTHKLPSEVKHTWLGEINLNYKSNQCRLVRNKRTYWNIFSSAHPFFPGSISYQIFSTFSPQLVQGDGEWRLKSVHHTLSLPFPPHQAVV